MACLFPILAVVLQTVKPLWKTISIGSVQSILIQTIFAQLSTVQTQLFRAGSPVHLQIINTLRTYTISMANLNSN